MHNINFQTMNKKDMKNFLTGYCKHRHKYCEHPNCFVKEQLYDLKIGYFDIESNGFNSDYYYMLTYAIKTRDKDEYCCGTMAPSDISTFQFDKNVCKQLIDDMMKYDVLITYYGTGFDIKFTRSRCLEWELEYPLFGTVNHKDIYYLAKRALKLNSYSLESVCRFFEIKGKNHIDRKVWRKAAVGDKASLEVVMDHNIRDVQILEKLHKKLEDYEKGVVKSI